MKVLVLYNSLHKFHLYKEIGMIPYYSSKVLNWESSIMCVENESNNKINDFRGIPILKMKNEQTIIEHLKIFATKYDMLILLGGDSNILKVFKQFNPKGITYQKLDSNYKLFEKKYLVPYSKCTIIQKIRKYFRLGRLLKRYNYADMVSTETEDGLNALKKIFYKSRDVNKFFCIPNGFDDDINKLCSLKLKVSKEKENIILTSGRLGSYHKNTEYLFSILKNIKNLGDWKVYFVGPIEKSFENKVKLFLEENNNSNKFVFFGNISDRQDYYEIFNKSRIFILPSLSEGFPLVLPEALYFGNFVIGTDVGGMQDIVVNDSIGKIIPLNDFKNAASIIDHELLMNEDVWEKRYTHIINHSEYFKWTNLIYKIEMKYNQLIEKRNKK